VALQGHSCLLEEEEQAPNALFEARLDHSSSDKEVKIGSPSNTTSKPLMGLWYQLASSHRSSTNAHYSLN